jgi:hypothetical protein
MSNSHDAAYKKHLINAQTEWRQDVEDKIDAIVKLPDAIRLDAIPKVADLQAAYERSARDMWKKAGR